MFLNMVQTPKLFQENFHMNVETFESLLKMVTPHLLPKRVLRRDLISPKQKLAIVLEFLASGDVQRHVSSCYRISQQHFGTIIDDVCNAIIDVLKFVIPPWNEANMKKMASEFQDKWNFPNCVGAIDGKHVRIKCPKHSGSLFYNYKLFKPLWTVTILSFMFVAVPNVQSSKILAVYAFPGKSHYSMHNALIKELIRRGHEVTMITGQTLAHLKPGSNYTEILIDPPYDFWKDIKKDYGADNLFDLTSMSVSSSLEMVRIIGQTTTEHALKFPKVQEIINAKKTEGVYDLLLAEQFYQEPFLTLALKYNIPVVVSSTLGYENHMSQQMGIIGPLSYVPYGYVPLTDKMSFFERVQNVYYTLYEDLYREFVYFPIMDEITKRYFSHLPIKIPTISNMEKNISVMLLNSHVPLTTSRPMAPGMISVGGMHIYPPKKLPNDMQKFLDEARDGVIYFSLGSNMQSKDMPTNKLKMFLKVFSGLKQRVLWKFENESIPDLPSNVMVKKWLPQSDILAHRNIKVFITHGGLFGTQEGIHYAVPMLGIPFYSDQHLNMKKAVQGGYAISFKFQDITEENLRSSLLEIMKNPKYKQNVQRISDAFLDRPLNARDTAMYWIEYVIRHKGAPHLRAAGLDLAWYQFNLLDIIAAAIVLIIISIVIIRLLISCILKQRNNSHKKKRQ